MRRYVQYWPQRNFKEILEIKHMMGVKNLNIRLKSKLIEFGVISFILALGTGCTMTENGMVFGTPDYEMKDIKVSNTDLQILLKANQILIDESKWENGLSRTCNNVDKYTLYCALESASIQVMGIYHHRQPALQEVRFIIRDQFLDRWSNHRLADFNANQNTSFTDIKYVIITAIETVNSKIAHNNGN